MKTRVIIAFFLLSPLLGFSQGESNNIYASLDEGAGVDSVEQFARFDHTSDEICYYSVRLSMINSDFKRGYFYEAAKLNGIYMVDKFDIHNDSALFMSGNPDKTKISLLIGNLYEQTINSKRPMEANSSGQGRQALNVPTVYIPCSTAQVACSNNIYSFPASTSGNATPPFNGYPNYGCLGIWGPTCPAWFYMQVGVAGDIIILIQQSLNHDVDFICWGPVPNLSDGCVSGLTGTCDYPNCCSNNQPNCINFYPKGNMTDCSASTDPTETCHIMNAQVGEVYILLISNWSMQPGTITFQQTGGTGQTNCNIIYNCSIIAISANPSACNDITNTFSVAGNVEFTNPPPSGTLTIIDNTAVPTVSQTFNPPFVSPLAYNLTGIAYDGVVHSISAAFSDSTGCMLTAHYSAPEPNCPQAQMSGGGEICNDGLSVVPVSISLQGSGPYTMIYAINGTPQPSINNYNGPSPYILNASIPGTYTMVSVSNFGCTGSGTVSGSALVIVDPLPVPVIT